MRPNPAQRRAPAAGCDKLNILSEEDLLAALGYGGITVRSVMTKPIESSKGPGRGHAARCRRCSRSSRRRSTSASATARATACVEGESGLLVRLARCCNPIPATRSRALSPRVAASLVHRADARTSCATTTFAHDRGQLGYRRPRQGPHGRDRDRLQRQERRARGAPRCAVG